jgi:hypothetical protein
MLNKVTLSFEERSGWANKINTNTLCKWGEGGEFPPIL